MSESVKLVICRFQASVPVYPVPVTDTSQIEQSGKGPDNRDGEGWGGVGVSQIG